MAYLTPFLLKVSGKFTGKVLGWVCFISLGQLTQIKTYLFCGFPHLGDLLEPELIGGELVGEAGGSGGKLLGHIPNTIRKLKSNKKLCKENNCQTLKSKFTITV